MVRFLREMPASNKLTLYQGSVPLSVTETRKGGSLCLMSLALYSHTIHSLPSLRRVGVDARHVCYPFNEIRRKRGSSSMRIVNGVTPQQEYSANPHC
jgi:hypothetical protein